MSEHTFHIPVMGLSFTVDTPVKVARFGISSVISIIQDRMIEQVREFYCRSYGYEYIHISDKDPDRRSKRIQQYLDMIQDIVSKQMENMVQQPFEEGNEIVKYFQLLPNSSPSRNLYNQMLNATGDEKFNMQEKLRTFIRPGSIDVNIMTKVDNLNYDENGDLQPPEFSDANSVLRGFAQSKLKSGVVFSAGMNPRLYAYIENFKDFYPDEEGNLCKKIILKVSDFRSALIQGKYLAKKGIWISEFRIESGLNCGGHAFPTEGLMAGPILEEFKNKRESLVSELADLCNQSLKQKNYPHFNDTPSLKISYQGGIGTAQEDRFLREYYNLDATGWGSPFLMVPEATNVDENTLTKLTQSKPEDFFLSHASPLGIPFNNFRQSSAEEQRLIRIQKNRPGSPCYKKHLAFSTEFSEKAICTSSREYLHLKIKEVEGKNLPDNERNEIMKDLLEKDCLCEGLATSVLIKNNLPVDHNLDAVTICPGPNLAYFTRVATLEEMVGHIYGKNNLLNSLPRQHTFVNELKMYCNYLQEEIDKTIQTITEKQEKYFTSFKNNLLNGIEYYLNLIPSIHTETEEAKFKMQEEFNRIKLSLMGLSLQLKPV